MGSVKGFTLIEVLVVIAIVALVIVAAISAIDPLEQVRKARDIERLKVAGDLLRGYGRYFAENKCHPWDPGAPNCTGESDARLYTATVPDFSATGVDYELIRQGQLKKQFADKRSIENSEMLVSNNDQRHLTACYEPASKKNRGGSFMALMDNINQTPVLGNECDDISGYPDGSCFICLGY